MLAAWIGMRKHEIDDPSGPCRVYSADLRIRVRETDLATYPDVAVVCGRLETSPDDRNGVVNPVVIVEVLSDSTESYDRGARLAHSRHLASLREYVLEPS